MLWKLSLTGIKSRLRDYLILFSGLFMSSAIFYMFEAMATNKAFLESNSNIQFISLFFLLGSFLLGIITFVYILYANSFLLSMRQKDYGMFMMLGAKTKKIATLIFIETFVIGIVATVVGALVGVLLTTVVNHLLVTELSLTVHHFSPLNINALVVTFIFYTILFILAAIINATKIAKKPILQLLRSDSTPVTIKKRKGSLLIEALFGLILLGVGYWAMSRFTSLKMNAIYIALVTIILGTYFLFHSVVIFALQLMKKSDRIIFKKINNFTLSQLSFRIREYTQMLSMVTIIFALALGASTVGIGSKNEVMQRANLFTYYDLVLNNPDQTMDQAVAALDPTENVTYQQKMDDTHLYYNLAQFNQQPFVYMARGDENLDSTKITVSGDELAQNTEAQTQLKELELPEQKNKELVFLPAAEFEALSGETGSLQVIRVADFKEDVDQLRALQQQNEANYPELSSSDYFFVQKVGVYDIFNSMYSGIEFMGFFLGIAFLTMLASCMMFKILSGAKSDIARYEMLRKIGTRRGLLKASIRKEIGVMFALPALLGVIHVLFGLQMFTALMLNPYQGILVPFVVFFIFYLLYYLLTVWIYTGIVLKKEA